VDCSRHRHRYRHHHAAGILTCCPATINRGQATLTSDKVAINRIAGASSSSSSCIFRFCLSVSRITLLFEYIMCGLLQISEYILLVFMNLSVFYLSLRGYIPILHSKIKKKQ
jgi:hypothetical protein